MHVRKHGLLDVGDRLRGLGQGIDHVWLLTGREKSHWAGAKVKVMWVKVGVTWGFVRSV